MKRNEMRLNNFIIPVFIFWFIPVLLISKLIINFVIDIIALFLIMKCLKINDIKNNIKTTIFKVWTFSFLSDIIGTIVITLPSNDIDNIILYEGAFKNIYAFLWVTVSILVTSFSIFILNYKYNLKNFDKNKRRKIALLLAIFTAPYFSYGAFIEMPSL